MRSQQVVRMTLAALGLSLGALTLAQTAPPPTPTPPEPTQPAPTPPVTAPATVQAVNVNTASKADLIKIPGLGAKLADEIIKNRPYKNEKELVNKVKGIGTKNIVKFRPYFLYK